MSTASKGFGQQAALALMVALLPQCGNDAGQDEGQCIPGELECACNGGQCLVGLNCVDAICALAVESETSSDTDSDSSMTDEETSQDVETETETETTDGDPCIDPETFCAGDCVNLSSDNNNCGECGKTCKVAPESGGCVQGACAPVWSECVDVSNPVPCSEVCQSEGLPGCMTAACGPFDMSVVWYSGALNCESGNGASDVQSGACETMPTGENDAYYRCCCEQ